MDRERSVDSTRSDEDAFAELPGERYDRRAEEFLELERALSTIDGAKTVLSGGSTTGVVTDARRVSPQSVPPSYPVEITTRRALEVTVSLDVDQTTTIYIEWPDRFTEDAPLVRLLASLDLHPSRFADLQGEEIPLELVEGQYVVELPAVPVESTHASQWVWGIVAGVALWALIWMFFDQIDVFVDIGGVVTSSPP